MINTKNEQQNENLLQNFKCKEEKNYEYVMDLNRKKDNVSN